MRRALTLLAVLALFAAGCGSSDDKSNDTTSTAEQPAESQPADTTSTESGSSGGTATIKPSPTKDLTKKPAIPRQPGDPPSQLVSQDIVKGTGATAEAGDTVSVRYVGVRFRDNQQFDASWERKPNS